MAGSAILNSLYWSFLTSEIPEVKNVFCADVPTFPPIIVKISHKFEKLQLARDNIYLYSTLLIKRID